MLAQRLRHRVTLQQLTTTLGERGSKVETFTTVLEHEPAEIVALSGRELVTANNEFGTITHRITIRYGATPIKAPTWRVIDEADDSGLVYNIKAVLPDPTLRKHVTLMCESGLNNG